MKVSFSRSNFEVSEGDVWATSYDGEAASFRSQTLQSLGLSAGTVQCPIGSNAGMAGQRDQISHRALVNSRRCVWVMVE